MSDPIAEAVSKGKELNKPTLIDLTAPWCTACDAQDRILSNLHEQIVQQSTMAIIDLEGYPDLAERYDILSLPSLLIFAHDGKLVWRSSGRIVQASELLAVIGSISSSEESQHKDM